MHIPHPDPDNAVRVYDVLRRRWMRVTRCRGLLMYSVRTHVFTRELVDDLISMDARPFYAKYNMKQSNIRAMFCAHFGKDWESKYDQSLPSMPTQPPAERCLSHHRNPPECVLYRGYWLTPDARRRMQEILELRRRVAIFEGAMRRLEEKIHRWLRRENMSPKDAANTLGINSGLFYNFIIGKWRTIHILRKLLPDLPTDLQPLAIRAIADGNAAAALRNQIFSGPGRRIV